MATTDAQLGKCARQSERKSGARGPGNDEAVTNQTERNAMAESKMTQLVGDLNSTGDVTIGKKNLANTVREIETTLQEQVKAENGSAKKIKFQARAKISLWVWHKQEKEGGGQ